jgi:two-component system sensor histidine kinase KdpD
VLQDLNEIVGTALQRASKILSQHRLEVELESDLPMLELDAVLFEQVLFNLLDNAAKYASPNSTIRVQSCRQDGVVKLQIIDEGSGIPPEDVERIFDKFHRAQKGDQVRAGTGLGLAISRGFIEAMGGEISAANRQDRQGAVFTIAIPIPAPTARLDTAA